MNARASGAVLLLATTALAGCAAWNEPRSEYQTVQANPNRDNEQATKEFSRALEMMEKGDPAKAEHALQQALVADVTHGPAHNNLGELYYQQKKFYLAAWEFEYASRLIPNRAAPLNNLGLVYEAVGRHDEAIAAYESAYAIEPENPQVIGNLARCRLRRGDKDGDVRRLLEELVFYDTRSDWVGWAKEQLAVGKLGTDPPAFELFDPSVEIIDTPLPGIHGGPDEIPLPMLEMPPR